MAGKGRADSPGKAPGVPCVPGRVFTFRAFLVLSLLALPVALGWALVIQAVRPPDGGFPAVGAGVRPLRTRISEALLKPQASVVECSVEEVNAHLAAVLPSRFLGGRGVVLLRAAVHVNGEKGEWVSEHEVWGRRVMLRIQARVWLAGGRIQVQRERVSLGRLDLGQWAEARLEEWLERVWPLLRKELALLHRLEDFRAEGGRIVMKVRAGTPAPEGG